MNPRSSGLLITFEGTEGAGKSTLIRLLADRFRTHPSPFRGKDIVLTREPGGSPLAEKIRQLVLHDPMSARAELFLYEAARAEHVAKVIQPALDQAKVVLCDRFTDSTLAYQAEARGLPWEEVHALNQVATGGLEPHKTVWLDLPVELGLSRAQEQTRFEAEGVAFQSRVRAGFEKIFQKNPQRWIRLDAELNTPQQLLDLLWEQLMQWNSPRSPLQ